MTMAPSAQVVQWMEKTFPKPRVDPEWLEGCTQWLEGDQNISPVTDFPEFMERVKGQLLESDLLDSMQSGTGFDAHISTMSGHLRGPPVLVQISAITEIGFSAFQLEQIRTAREERMLAGVGNEEGEDDGDVEVEGEGPMPKYPRGTLRFQLTDGARTIQAMEYRQISKFALGNTPLGYKMQLKGTKFQNGMAMLEPDTVILLGGKQSELEAKQPDDFKRGLYARLGKPLPAEQIVHEPTAEPEANAPVPIAVRSPLRDISPPPIPAFPQHNDDVDMEPRRRLPVNSSLNDVPSSSASKDVKQNRPIIGLPSRNNKTGLGATGDITGDSQGKRSTPLAERATLVHAGTQGTMTKITTSSYFNGNAIASGSGSTRLQNRQINTAVENLDFNLEPTGRQMSRMLPSPEPFQSYESPANPDPFDFDFLDEMDQENQPLPPAASNKGKARQDDSMGISVYKPPLISTIHDGPNSDDYGMDDDNDFENPSFLKEIDILEKAALQSNHKASSVLPASSSSGSGSNISSSKSSAIKSSGAHSSPRTSTLSSTHPQSAQIPTHAAFPDVIEIEDSDEDMQEIDDKENEPVATRNVRRRTDHANIAGPSRASSFQNHRSQNMSQKLGRPIVLATDPNDIIDLSDSD